jgi:hypothetical protein
MNHPGQRSTEGLDNWERRSKIPPISGEIPGRTMGIPRPGFMTPSSPSPLPEKKSNMAPCKHPRVQVVAREEDSEFVECKECGEIFESSEFKDMVIEDTQLSNES